VVIPSLKREEKLNTPAKHPKFLGLAY
jgi:hypothetical protein